MQNFSQNYLNKFKTYFWISLGFIVLIIVIHLPYTLFLSLSLSFYYSLFFLVPFLAFIVIFMLFKINWFKFSFWNFHSQYSFVCCFLLKCYHRLNDIHEMLRVYYELVNCIQMNWPLK